MGTVRDYAERMWTGADRFTGDMHPLAMFFGGEQLDDGLYFAAGLSNVTALDGGDGLALIDTGPFVMSRSVYDQVRAWTSQRVHTAVYTHGHVDHVFGLAPFEAEAPARVVAHEAVSARFDRYKLTAGYNAAINARQFRVPGLRWPTDYRYPDVTYRDAMTLAVGALEIELRHDRGETDDHTWAWIPARKLLCTGDLFIWASPNCGNPQKAQRYPREWAAALRKMAALGAETLLPGHGPPIFGADRVQQALGDTADLLETIVDQALALMNDGARLDDVLHGVTVPAALVDKPYLRPVYDDPAFIVRNVWRLYGGWYDGNPAHLKPAPEAALGRAVAALAGGAGALAAHAVAIADAGDLAVAGHLAELAWRAAPTDVTVRAARASINRKRAEAETSLMARSIFRQAAEDSEN